MRVVFMSECPAFAISAIGLEPDAASFVRRLPQVVEGPHVVLDPGLGERGPELLCEELFAVTRSSLGVTEDELLVALEGRSSVVGLERGDNAWARARSSTRPRRSLSLAPVGRRQAGQRLTSAARAARCDGCWSGRASGRSSAPLVGKRLPYPSDLGRLEDAPAPSGELRMLGSGGRVRVDELLAQCADSCASSPLPAT
jgi:hypothetical protein